MQLVSELSVNFIIRYLNSESDISASDTSDSQSTITIEEDTNIVPSYKPRTDVLYKVVHKKQDTVDESVYTTAEIEEKKGYTGQTVTPAIKKNYGSDYNQPNVQTTTINADGSTVVEYLYDYKYYFTNPHGNL